MKINLDLELTFADNITNEEILKVMENVSQGIAYTANTSGIAPETTYTMKVVVKYGSWVNEKNLI